MRTLNIRTFVLLGSAFLMAGCGSGGPDRQAAADEAEASRGQVVDALRGMTEVASGLGAVGDANGGYAVCGSPPAEAVEFRASVPLQVDDPADAVPRLTDRLAADGWKVVGQETQPRPWANLERDEVTGSIRVSPRQGSTGLVLAVAGPCVRIADGQTSDFSLRQEPIDLG